MARSLKNDAGANSLEEVSLYNYMKEDLTNILNVHPSKIMLKIIPHRLESYMEKEMPNDTSLMVDNQSVTVMLTIKLLLT